MPVICMTLCTQLILCTVSNFIHFAIYNVLSQNLFCHDLRIFAWRKIKTKIKPVEKLPIDKNVTVIAIIIPKIPKKFPCLDVSGEDNPLNAKINNTPEIK